MSEKVTFNANQTRFIEWLAMGKAKRIPPTQVMLAAELEISDKTLCRYKNPEFIRAVNDRALELVKESVPNVLESVKEMAMLGNHQQQKMILSMANIYDEKHQITHTGEVTIKTYQTITPDNWDDDSEE